MAKIGKTLAGRLTRRLMIWLAFIVVGLSFFVFYIANLSTRDVYFNSYHNRTLINKEYIQRVISDVYVAVINNIYYLEKNLDQPDRHKDVVSQIVKHGTRVRSCGISFIKDYYYPQKGHHFCPFAWRNPQNPNVIEEAEMGDSSIDYLTADWFLDVVNSDSAYWSDPFYDGYDETTTLAAYMSPIHDKEGRVVAVLGADISLDWLTSKLNETDVSIDQNALIASKILNQKSSSFIINNDGTFMTHLDKKKILKDNFLNHIEAYDDHSDVDGLLKRMRSGMISENEDKNVFLYDGQKSYVFYTPIKYTEWIVVTIVPWQSIDMLGIVNGCMLLLFIAIVLFIFVVVCYYSMKKETRPLQELISVANDISNRKFDTPIPETKHEGELRELCTSFENIQTSLSCYVNEQNDAKSSEKDKRQL